MKIGKYLLLAVLISALLGCVSSTEIKRTAADPQEAFSRHIKLAMQYIGSKNRDLARVHLQKAAKFESRDRRAQLLWPALSDGTGDSPGGETLPQGFSQR